MLAGPQQVVVQPESPQLGYDRIEQISTLVRAFYPSLDIEGMLTVDIVFPRSSDIYFSFRHCRTGSGIPGGSIATGVRNCWPADGREKLLSARIVLGGDKNHPLIQYNANGTFLEDPQMIALRDFFKNKAYSKYEALDKTHYWTHADALQVLRSKNPQFGPDKKEAFLALLPTEMLRAVTGCTLQPSTARFEIWPLTSTFSPKFEWVVEGLSGESTGCSASFEPFHGRLVSLTR